MSTFEEMLARVKREIQEIDVDEAHARWTAKDPHTTFIDIRERDEFDAGHITESLWVSRGFLELQIETLIPDRAQRLVLYCQAGIRSVLSAKSLGELGYRDVVSVSGGMRDWKQRGYPIHTPTPLTREQRQRYSRHLLIPEVGEEGQRKLLDARVLMMGVGGLGSPAAFYLAAAGVGRLGVIDSDIVDRSNLQRQILHTEDRIGQPKVESAREALTALNPDVDVVAYNTRLTSQNVDEIFSQYDLVVDGGDNFPTRYLVNDAAIKHNIPVVHGSVYRFDGQVTTFIPRIGPCYRCLFPSPPPPELAPSCQEAGVLGVLPGVIGLLQAVEAIKLIIGAGQSLSGRLLCYSALETRFQELRLRRDKNCPVCADDVEWPGYIDYEAFCGVA